MSSATRVALRFMQAKMPIGILRDDHRLVVLGSGSHRRIIIVKFVEPKPGQHALGMVGRMIIHWNAGCEAFSVGEAAAVKGYGWLLYDAAMEVVAPKSLAPDLTSSTSAAARHVWDLYADRSDVHAEPLADGCARSDWPSLRQRYTKRPGQLASMAMTASEFARDAGVIEWLGHAPQNVENLQAEVWDYTPNVPGAWE